MRQITDFDRRHRLNLGAAAARVDLDAETEAAIERTAAGLVEEGFFPDTAMAAAALVESSQAYAPPVSAALSDSPRPARPGRGVDHWLLFDHIDGRMQVVGCRCGFEADREADCGYGDSVVQHLLEVGVTWRAKCSCGWKCWGKPTEVERLTREHDDSPLGSHVVSWDVPGVRPWSREMEAL